MPKKFSWNRNVSHHRIAMTKFAVIAFIQATFTALLVVLGMGIASDGTREYVVYTAVLGLMGWVVAYWASFTMMGVMYRWVIESDLEKGEKYPPTPPIKETYYQDKAGNFHLAQNGEKWGRGQSVNPG